MLISTLAELRQQLDQKEVSAVEVANHYLSQIEKTAQLLNSFITILSDDVVRKNANEAQQRIDSGRSSMLTGIPYAAKDLFCTKGIETTAGSKILTGYLPPYSATAIERCREALLLGKTNMDEFAMGSSTEYSAFSPTRNPFDLDRVPGGSSGGSAAAVAAEQAVFALGTDTGGSIRQPASFCAVIGMKPTYGRISRYGVIAMASSLDTVGFFTQTVTDAALLLRELAGPDPLDSTTPDVTVDNYPQALQKKVKGLRIGIPKEYHNLPGLHAQVKELYEKAIKTAVDLGATVEEVSLPHTPFALATYYILCPSEVSSNLARYDGMQYGQRAKGAESLEEVLLKTREEGFGEEAKRRIIIGTFCLSSGYYDAYYKKAQQTRTLIREDFEEAFRTVDLLLTPTSPFPPFRIGEKTKDPVAMYLADIFTVPISLAGLPALSLPVGFIEGLPAAVQVVAPQFQESKILQMAYALEQGLDLGKPSLAV